MKLVEGKVHELDLELDKFEMMQTDHVPIGEMVAAVKCEAVCVEMGIRNQQQADLGNTAHHTGIY